MSRTTRIIVQRDLEAMDIVLDTASLDDTHGKAMPVSIFMFQEVKNGAQKTLHRLVGETYSMGEYTNKNEITERAESGGCTSNVLSINAVH